MAEIPSNLVRSGMCATVEINGRTGIMTRYGYFFDISTQTWTKKADPPVVSIAGVTNALWTFRGKPTIFGHPVCDDVGRCEFKEVWQYDPDMDIWEPIGEMLHSRTYTTVIEVPAEWCEVLGISTTTIPPTTESVTTTYSTGSNLKGFSLLIFSVFAIKFALL